MDRKDTYYRKDQIDFINSLPGTFSDHVRLAVDDYIAKKRLEKAKALNVSSSKSVKNG